MYTLQARHQHGVAHTFRAEGHDASEDGTGRGTPIVMASGQANAELAHDLSPALNCNRDGAPIAFDTTQVTSKANRTRVEPGRECHTLSGEGHPPAVAHAAPVSPTLGKESYGSKKCSSGQLADFTMVQGGPRRLTPRECERLQGWPDDWTRWGRTPDGEVVELADSPRYRMIGNGVSAPVSAWIGCRIMAVEAAAVEREAA